MLIISIIHLFPICMKNLPKLTTIALFLFATSARAELLIDVFDAAQTVSVSGAPLGPKSIFDSITAPGILGGERDVFLQRTSANSGSISVDVDGSFAGALAYASSPATTGSALMTYDGTDGASGINFTGLGGIDLTQAGLNLGINLSTTSDNGASVTFTIYTDATHFSLFTVPVLADPTFTFTDYFVDFASFVPTGADGGANYTNVGAITVLLDGTSNPGTDIGIDYFAASVPEPAGSLLVLCAGLFWMMRRRERHS